MNDRWMLRVGIAWFALTAAGAGAYPGGTPSYQTDVAPFCASCHSSRNEAVLAGAGERATRYLVENHHLALIRAGKGLYEELSEADRAALVEQIRATDAHSSVTIEVPPRVAHGEIFEVVVRVTGGAGPVVGVALVDRAHRWFARPAASAGWKLVGAPTVIGPDDKPQSEWLGRRPESAGRGISFVNITGVASDAVAGRWATGKVVFTLQAPDRPGDYPLTAAYFYGTEKATPLGWKRDPLDRKMIRGGFTGGSGRVVFADEHLVSVK